MINPFFWYSIVNFIIYILYGMRIAKIYPEMTRQLSLFILTTSVISFVFGILIKNKIKIYPENIRFSDKYIKKNTRVIICLYILQFLYVGKVPIIEHILKTGYTYVDFKGIPFFNVLLYTYTGFFSLYIISVYALTKKKKLLLYYLLLQMMYILIYYRSYLVLSLFMSIILYFSYKKISLKNIFKFVSVGVLSIYLFGVLGNIRHESKWNDSWHIKYVARIESNYEFFDPFLWGYTYATSPISNLQNTINLVEPENNFSKLIYESLIPDYILKRIKSSKENRIKLIVPNLNVSSGYIKQYLNGGYLGMYFIFLIYSTFNFLVLLFIKRDNIYLYICLSILSCSAAFMGYINMYIFSGLNFQFYYSILFYILLKIKLTSRRTYERNI